MHMPTEKAISDDVSCLAAQHIYHSIVAQAVWSGTCNTLNQLKFFKPYVSRGFYLAAPHWGFAVGIGRLQSDKQGLERQLLPQHSQCDASCASPSAHPAQLLPWTVPIS